MKAHLIEAAVPFFFVLILLEIGVAALLKRRYHSVHGSINDLSLAIFQTIIGLMTNLAALSLYVVVYENFAAQHFIDVPYVPHENPWTRTDSFPFLTINWVDFFWWTTIFILVDFCYYWFHRSAHEVNIIWATHVVHHSSEEYNLVVAIRQGSFQMLFNGLFFLPLAIMGVSVEMLLICYSINLLYQFLIHTRVVDKLGFLELFMNTPSHHRVHHGRNPRYCDKNHGGVFIVWDRLFGTFQEEDEEPIYGITVPLRSFNPVWGNVHYFRDIFRDAYRASKWTDKIKILFKSPGWRPEELGGMQYPKEVDRASYKPFQVHTPVLMLVYCVFQIIPPLWVLQYVQDNYMNMPIYKTFAIGFFILLTLSNIGGALESRVWAYYSEVGRLLTLTFVGVFSLLLEAYAPLYGFGMMGIGVVGLLWLVLMRGSFNNRKPEETPAEKTVAASA